VLTRPIEAIHDPPNQSTTHEESTHAPEWTRAVCAIAALCLVAAIGASAQGLTGTISGTLKDQTGGVLPGVSVTLASPSLIGGSQTRVTEGMAASASRCAHSRSLHPHL
jgi:hypothetical protein